MKIFIKIVLLASLFLTALEAKVGVCEVQPEDKKEQYLECLVKEAKRTDEIADINMVADGYGVYAMGDEIYLWQKKAIKKGDPKSMYNQAKSYSFFVINSYKLENNLSSIPEIIKGLLVDYPQERNQPKKAIQLYKKAALLNYKDSIAKLSEVMEVVYGKEGAIEQYKKEMAEGDKNTYRFLANLYVRYEQYDMALKLYENQLKKEPSNAHLYALIGSLYETHLRDKKTAKSYYEKATEGGDSTAMYNLGIMAGDNEEYDKAEEYFRASEKAGRKNGSRMICYMYKTKLNDYERAEECYLNKAKDSNPSNLYAVGIFYMDDIGNYEKGVDWYKKAYNAGSSSAAINLGSHYRNNYHDDYNKEKATYWYKKAAGMGEPGGWSYLYEQEVFK